MYEYLTNVTCEKLMKGSRAMRNASIYFSSDFTLILQQFIESGTLKLPRTQRDYFTNVCSICDFLKKDYLHISYSDAQYYFDHLSQAQKLKVSSLNAKLASLRSISSYILKNKDAITVDATFTNVFSKVNIAAQDNYVNKESIPSTKEIGLILDSVRTNDMLFLILSLIIKCSLTVSQICNLKPSQIALDGANRGCIAFTNGKKTRFVKLPVDIMDLLVSYTNSYGVNNFLFYNKHKKPLRPRTLESLFQLYLTKSGIKKAFTLQDIRNASIIYMLQGGASQSAVADYVGVSGRWMFRYNQVIDELNNAPCDYLNFNIKQ